MEEIKITTEFITLGQFIKYIGVISNGSFAKIYLQDNNVLVNGEKENRRGRKIYPDYIVMVENKEYKVTK